MVDNDRDATVFVVDDDSSIQVALGRLLKLAGLKARVFSSAEAFLQANIHPDVIGCLLVDIKMPGMTGIELQEELQRKGVSLPIIFITGQATVSLTVQAMKAGAIDFLEKPFDGDQLTGVISRAIKQAREKASERVEIRELMNRHRLLTPREREVFAAVARGGLNKQIAYRLGTKEKTIKVHRARVMKKMQAGCLADLIRMADKLFPQFDASSPRSALLDQSPI